MLYYYKYIFVNQLIKCNAYLADSNNHNLPLIRRSIKVFRSLKNFY